MLLMQLMMLKRLNSVKEKRKHLWMKQILIDFYHNIMLIIKLNIDKEKAV